MEGEITRSAKWIINKIKEIASDLNITIDKMEFDSVDYLRKVKIRPKDGEWFIIGFHDPIMQDLMNEEEVRNRFERFLFDSISSWSRNKEKRRQFFEYVYH